MPIELNHIVQSAERTVSVPTGTGPDDAIVLTWNPTRMTREVWSNYQAWQAESRGSDVSDPFMIADLFIVPLATGWDITVDGAPYPLTVEHVTNLGMTLVERLMRAIGDDYQDMREEKKGSDARS